MSSGHSLPYNEDFPNLTPDSSRELTAQEWILAHKPQSYGEIAELVDTAMAHAERPCVNGECDEGATCERHDRTGRVADRYVRMRGKRWARIQELAREYMRAAPVSVAEFLLRRELDRYPERSVEKALDYATKERWRLAFASE